jgi:hypothetical protein
MVVFPAKDLPEPVGCCFDGLRLCAALDRGHAPKNLNTVHFLMKRFNKI